MQLRDAEILDVALLQAVDDLLLVLGSGVNGGLVGLNMRMPRAFE